MNTHLTWQAKPLKIKLGSKLTFTEQGLSNTLQSYKAEQRKWKYLTEAYQIQLEINFLATLSKSWKASARAVKEAQDTRAIQNNSPGSNQA